MKDLKLRTGHISYRQFSLKFEVKDIVRTENKTCFQLDMMKIKGTKKFKRNT